jgi:hypothetical protein
MNRKTNKSEEQPRQTRGPRITPQEREMFAAASEHMAALTKILGATVHDDVRTLAKWIGTNLERRIEELTRRFEQGHTEEQVAEVIGQESDAEEGQASDGTEVKTMTSKKEERPREAKKGGK